VGLAAPQLGVNVRLMVFNPSGVRGEKDFVLVNPYIISSDKKQDVDLEGCLSFLQIGADVKVSFLLLDPAQNRIPSCLK
jgi:peptide deformylase